MTGGRSPRTIDPGAGRRVAILGVGNELRRDDFAGVRIVRELGRRLEPRPDLLLVEAGNAPENFTGTLRRFRPSTVLIVDAAEMGLAPGSLAWVDWPDVDGLSASTHILPPSVLGRFLAESLGCDVIVLGVQPSSVDFGQGLTPEVEASVGVAAGRLVEWLERSGNCDPR